MPIQKNNTQMTASILNDLPKEQANQLCAYAVHLTIQYIGTHTVQSQPYYQRVNKYLLDQINDENLLAITDLKNKQSIKDLKTKETPMTLRKSLSRQQSQSIQHLQSVQITSENNTYTFCVNPCIEAALKKSVETNKKPASSLSTGHLNMFLFTRTDKKGKVTQMSLHQPRGHTHN
jgi:hypothetical protein